MLDRVYWFAFALILAGAISLRAFWTHTLQLPFTTPDSGSYYDIAILTGFFAFSEHRTPGTPTLINVALAIFRGPVGILVLHNVLVLGAATMLALAIKRVLGQRLLSLIVLFVVLFSSKGLAFEYQLMSEHDARVFYLAYAAVALWFMRRPSWWLAAILGLLVACNILVKPDALVLIVATLMMLAVVWWRSERRRQVVVSAAVFMVAAIVPVLGYMGEYKARNGIFALSSIDGQNQFSHVGHLTRLDGGFYPDLKDRLRPLLAPYAAYYAAKGNYQPNWLIYGSVNAELARDFGDRSPKREIDRYVERRDGMVTLQAANRIYRDLAFEGMATHPVEFAQYAFESGTRLWREGYTFRYREIFPTAQHFERHRADRTEMRKGLYLLYGGKAPQCVEGEPLPPRIYGWAWIFIRGPLASCDPLPYDDPSTVSLVKTVDAAYATVVRPLAAVYPYLPAVGAAAAIVAGLLLIVVRDRRALSAFGFGALLVTVVLGYTMFHGMVNAAEDQRMAANVQDCVIVASLAFIVSLVLAAQSAAFGPRGAGTSR